VSEKTSEEQTAESVIEDMRRILITTGQLSSAQEKTLKLWCMIGFDDVVSAEINYDLSKYTKTMDKQDHYIKFFIFSEKNEQDFLEARCEKIAGFCRNLFWSEITIEITINNKKVYESPASAVELQEK
jgi:hypothetical protein